MTGEYDLVIQDALEDVGLVQPEDEDDMELYQAVIEALAVDKEQTESKSRLTLSFSTMSPYSSVVNEK